MHNVNCRYGMKWTHFAIKKKEKYTRKAFVAPMVYSKKRTKKRKIKYMSSLCAICFGVVVQFGRFSFQSLANGVCVTNVTIYLSSIQKRDGFYGSFFCICTCVAFQQNDCLSSKTQFNQKFEKWVFADWNPVFIFQLKISTENFDENRSKIANWSIWFVVYFTAKKPI